jgi:hypothetical protein
MFILENVFKIDIIGFGTVIVDIFNCRVQNI